MRLHEIRFEFQITKPRLKNEFPLNFLWISCLYKRTVTKLGKGSFIIF